jgi:hypothetical protein
MKIGVDWIKMKLAESIGELIEKYLDCSKNWERSHIRSIGEIEETNPWRETNYRHASGFYISHWENVVTPGCMSGPSPRHVWKLANSKGEESWGLSFSYGIAPYKRK